VFAAEVEFEDEAHVVWTHTPPNPAHLPCRLSEDRMTHAYYLAQYEDSRERSPFNQRLCARRNHPGEPEELCQALRSDIGLSEGVIDEWVRSGSLAASFEPPSGPKPPPATRKPPSRR
jgi:hypothetical protein